MKILEVTLVEDKAILQKIVNFAQKNGYKLKYSPKRQSLTFIHSGLNHRVDTRLSKDGWVWFNDHNNGMSGNDPVNEFYGTFVGLHDQAKEDFEWQKSQSVDETASVGGVSAGAVATVVKPMTKKPIKRKSVKETDDVSVLKNQNQLYRNIVKELVNYVNLRDAHGYENQLDRSRSWNRLLQLLKNADKAHLYKE